MNERGFSLVETLVAVSLVALSLSALAQIFAMSAHANADARRTTMAAVLAGQKMEQLRGASADLEPRSLDSLDQNVPGLCDFLDEYGRSLGGDGVPPVGTTYIRRWSVSTMPSAPSETLILQVVVRHAGRGARVGWGSRGSTDERVFGGAHLVTMKTRGGG